MRAVPDLTWIELAVLALAVAAGALVQGTIGFGFALVSAPVLSLIDPTSVPSTLLLLALPINVTVLWRERSALDTRGALQVSVGMLIGSALAVLVLRGIPAERLTVAFGVAVVLSAVASVMRPPRTARASARVGAGIGSGVINTVVGTGGPLVALVYRRHAGPVLRSTLAATFAIAVGLSMAGLAVAERLTWSAIKLAVLLVPALAVGVWASGPMIGRVDHHALGRLVIGFVIVSGLATIARGLL